MFCMNSKCFIWQPRVTVNRMCVLLARRYVMTAGFGFVPMMPNTGGGVLLRKKDDKYTSVGGSKGYRWKESDIVKSLGQEDRIDLLYFNTLIKEAVETIQKFGPIEGFIEDYGTVKNYFDDEEDLIGFDDCPPIQPIANAIILGGEEND